MTASRCFTPCAFALALTALFFAVSIPAQSPQPGKPEAKPEIVSPLGVKHFANADEKGEIAAAEQKLTADPKNIDLLIALGRAQAGVWRYKDAIETYTRAIKLVPNDAKLYRHRGHRYISTRQFDKAVADLKRAAKLNDKDFDIWYHLALAHFLKGQFDKAAIAYERCRQVAEADTTDKRDDSVIAVSDWLYMTYRRLGKPAEAAKVLERITPDMKVKENKSYFDRLLFYKGLKKEEELVNIEKATDLEIATVGYGLGNWHLYNGHPAKAEELFRRIVSGKYWPAFGFIAAEAELARKKK
ncbi:MAG: tetratricopeptide repeat protein [Blastocatellia bacterium]